MGTIISRKRADGTVGYTAQILIKRKGKIVHREAKTFDRKQIAKAWLARRETELSEPGAMERRPDPTLAVVIDRYVANPREHLDAPRNRSSARSRPMTLPTCHAARSPAPTLSRLLNR